MTNQADQQRRRDRERLIADLEQARLRRRRRVLGLRLPSSFPIPRTE
jgi:hypothetical protein